MNEPMTVQADPWRNAMLAAAVLATDPARFGGAVVRAFPGPVRDRWLAAFQAMLPADTPVRKMPMHIADSRLLGGLDLTATLSAGKPVLERGLLAETDGGVILMPMAERLPASVAGRLAGVLDRGAVALQRDGIAADYPARIAVIALDEGLAEDERPPAALRDRLAFRLDLADIGLRETEGPALDRDAVSAASRRLPDIEIGDPAIEALCAAGLALGVSSMRAMVFATHAARAIAALGGGKSISDSDVGAAARLVLAPLATQIPDLEPPDPPGDDEAESSETPPQPDLPDNDTPEQDSDDGAGHDLGTLVVETAVSAIPAGILAQLQQGERRSGQTNSSGKAGALAKAARRGRPIGTRRGDPGGGAQLNVVETLRAAAPWQTLRRGGSGLPAVPESDRSIQVRRDDLRINRLKHRTETTTIFVVDASGSSALQRLGEAKGAVELLLADCYIRRDRVALIAFRGETAELLLPPTRSLVRAKRSISGLPGGGGTPLAAGLTAATAVAEAARRRGETPVVVLLTDGRANIGLDGKPGRPQAQADAKDAARYLRSMGIASLLVDSSRRPQDEAQALAAEMDAVYLPLPHGDAAALSDAVRRNTDGIAGGARSAP